MLPYPQKNTEIFPRIGKDFLLKNKKLLILSPAEAVRLLIERMDINPNPEKEKTAFKHTKYIENGLR